MPSLYSPLRAARALLFVSVVSAAPLAAQQTPPAPGAETTYVRTNVMIAMRDGVRLNTEVFAPKAAREPLPILLVRTPYSVGPNRIRAVNSPYKELHEDGYIFVFQDIRGRYKSEGQFVMMRAPRVPDDPRGVDEASDAYDTIDWLVKNVPNNNGRVGILGVSYDGWTTAMALLDPHPAFKAASPQASPSDMWMGDDFHHNGAFRLSYGFEYAAMMEATREQKPFTFDRYDTYEWYLKLGSLANVNAKYLEGKIPTWNDFVAHPNYDRFWQRQTILNYLNKPVTVPTLNVAGWWDQEDFYGPITIYRALEKQDRNNLNFFVAGPWNHGGWNRPEGNKLGNVDFGGPTSLYYRERIQAPFFRCHLKGRCDAPMPEAITFEPGANEWRTWDSWPPRSGIVRRKLHFHPNGRLSFEQPRRAPGAEEFDAYISDPARPVPYRARPIQATYDRRGSGWSAWLTEDQRFVHNRPDVLSWETEPLTEDVTIAGEVMAELFAATTGTDADWIVKLIDVYPQDVPADPKMGGYQLMVANEVFRGRFRNSFERPSAVVPNQVAPYRFSLHDQNYRFKRGHKIMVQVQSTWFPLIDRNPQTFVPNIFEAKESDFRPATMRVYRSPQFASGVVIPVVEPERP
ncbi:MAG TPA: CocE/NonD family hydrolase [Vicinamibacterales bacterium]|nr:CocE/NonD family hydrolase [Vicinamibacterales bacterium]